MSGLGQTLNSIRFSFENQSLMGHLKMPGKTDRRDQAFILMVEYSTECVCVLTPDSVFKMFFMGEERYLPHNQERFVLHREDGGGRVDLHKTYVNEIHIGTNFIVLPILWKGMFHNEKMRSEEERENRQKSPHSNIFVV